MGATLREPPDDAPRHGVVPYDQLEEEASTEGGRAHGTADATAPDGEIALPAEWGCCCCAAGPRWNVIHHFAHQHCGYLEVKEELDEAVLLIDQHLRRQSTGEHRPFRMLT